MFEEHHRHGKTLAALTDQQGPGDGQGHGQGGGEDRTLAPTSADAEGAAEALDLAPCGIAADAATADAVGGG